ncbi:MAG TPA: ATP-dependent DNA helicase RecG, partial [Thermopolyspora sp.]
MRVKLGDVTSFDEPLSKVLGPKTARMLDDVLGLTTVGGLLRHYPRRYAERGELTSIDSLEAGEHVTVVGEVSRMMRKPMRNKPGTWLEVEVVDGRGDKIYLSFFGKAGRAVEQRMRPGDRGMFSGKADLFGKGRHRRWQLAHPDSLLFSEAEVSAEEFANAPVPIYPAGSGLTSWAIARSVRLILDTLGALDDPLPEEMRARLRLMGLAEALVSIHRPRDFDEIGRSRRRLKFDEAFVLQAVLLRRRQAAAAWPAVPRPAVDDGLRASFDRR